MGWLAGAAILALVQMTFGDPKELRFILGVSAMFAARTWVLTGPLLALLDPQRQRFATARSAFWVGALQGVLALPMAGLVPSLNLSGPTFWVLHLYVVAGLVGGTAFALYYRGLLRYKPAE
jgi:hypothetical protein